MTKLKQNIIETLRAVSQSVTGEYDTQNTEIIQMRDDVLNRSTSSKQDRINLKSDANKIASDFNKSFQEKKALLNG